MDFFDLSLSNVTKRVLLRLPVAFMIRYCMGNDFICGRCLSYINVNRIFRNFDCSYIYSDASIKYFNFFIEAMLWIWYKMMIMNRWNSYPNTISWIHFLMLIWLWILVIFLGGTLPDMLHNLRIGIFQYVLEYISQSLQMNPGST